MKKPSKLSQGWDLDYVAEVLGVHRRTIERMIQVGQLLSYKVRGRRLVRAEVVRAHIRKEERRK